MKLEEFEGALRTSNPIGTTLQNPGGGTSEIIDFRGGKVSYVRGSSTISVKVNDLYRAYSAFRGERVSSTDLRKFAPEVFDSNARPSGHSCNCTFLFLTLDRAGLASGFAGEGVRGSPYSVLLHEP